MIAACRKALRANALRSALLLTGLCAAMLSFPSAGGGTWTVISSTATAQTATAPPVPSPLHTQFGALLERETRNAPDLQEGPQVHLVYLVPADRPDERLDQLGLMENLSRAIQAWLGAEAGVQLRLDQRPSARTPDGLMADVTFVRSQRTADQLSDPVEVREELEGRPDLDRPEYRLLVLTPGEDGAPLCGATAGNPLDEVYAPATVFLDADPRCGTRSFSPDGVTGSWAELVALHELLHTLGAVDELAPRFCALPNGHVCITKATVTNQTEALDPEAVDVMWPYITAPLSQRVLDRGRDDYFGHQLPLVRDVHDSPWLQRRG